MNVIRISICNAYFDLSTYQQDAQPKTANDVQVTQSTLQPSNEKTSPFRTTNRSLSFRERREPTDSSDKHKFKRKSSVDFDSLAQLSVLPLGDQMLAALNADDIIPEKVFLISIRDSVGQVSINIQGCVAGSMNTLERDISVEKMQ